MPRKLEKEYKGAPTKYRDKSPTWITELIKTVKEENPSGWSRIQPLWQSEWQPPRPRRKREDSDRPPRKSYRGGKEIVTKSSKYKN